MNLLHLRAFYQVGLHLSFSRAASELGVSQPNVSMQVRKLEESLGVALVEVLGRQLRLTAAGQTLYARAQQMFQIEAEAEAAISGLRNLRTGHVRVGASTIPATYLLPAVIARFRGRYPGISVHPQMGNTAEIAGRLTQGEIDFAMVGEEVGHPPELEFEPLCTDCLVLVALPEHPLVRGAAIGPAELVQQPLILREPGSSTRDVLVDRLATLGLAVHPVMELGGNEAIKQAVLAGLGLAVLSRFAVADELQSGRLAAVAVARLNLERHLVVARRREHTLPAAARAFLEVLRTAPLPLRCQ